MPIQVDSYASSAQTAVNSSIQQRQDQVRVDQRKEDDKEKTKTKPASTAAAQSQPSEARSGNVVKFSQNDSGSKAQQSQSQQRGSIVNISI